MKKKNNIQNNTKDAEIYQEIKDLINQTKVDIYHYVNFRLVQTYWMIGKILYEKCGKSEQGIKFNSQLAYISEQLTLEFGKGYDKSNLRYMRQFYMTYPLRDALRCEVNWTQYRTLIKIKDEKIRSFYENEIISNQWSSRQLDNQIKRHYYERIVSHQSQKQIVSKNHSTDFLVDPLILDFLQLPLHYQEKDLEEAILTNISEFLRELGRGYSFVDRQKAIMIDGKHFFIDLVFYNSVLHCYVLIELKKEILKPQDIGQLQLYTKYCREEMMHEGDNPPIGILLCSNSNETVVEYALPDDNDSIYVSQYLDYLPSKEEFKKILKLRD